jgi:hypothetical protein
VYHRAIIDVDLGQQDTVKHRTGCWSALSYTLEFYHILYRVLDAVLAGVRASHVAALAYCSLSEAIQVILNLWLCGVFESRLCSHALARGYHNLESPVINNSVNQTRPTRYRNYYVLRSKMRMDPGTDMTWVQARLP